MKIYRLLSAHLIVFGREQFIVTGGTVAVEVDVADVVSECASLRHVVVAGVHVGGAAVHRSVDCLLAAPPPEDQQGDHDQHAAHTPHRHRVTMTCM